MKVAPSSNTRKDFRPSRKRDFQFCTYKYGCYVKHIRRFKCEAMEKDNGKKWRNKSSADKITLEQYVSTTAPLIDMEKVRILIQISVYLFCLLVCKI